MAFLTIDAFGDTNVGLVRKNNEDYLTYFEPGTAEVVDRFGRLFIVADGVGGAATGEVASKYAAQKVLHTYFSQPSLKPWQRIKAGMKHANETLVAYIRQNAQARMATTMTAAAVNGTEMTVVNVGDSRAYLLRNGQIKQITQDHNLVNEMIRNGVLTEEEAKTAKVKNQLTSSLGGHESFKADVFVETLMPGDRVLLCSDGFCRYAEDPEIVRKFMQTGTPQQIVANCIQYARNSGGQDNITVLSMEIGELVPATPEGADHGARPDPVDIREVVSNPLTLDARSPAQEAALDENQARAAQQVSNFQPNLSVPQIPPSEAYAVPGLNMAADDSDLLDTDQLRLGNSLEETAVVVDEETGSATVTSDNLRAVSARRTSEPSAAPQAAEPEANTRTLGVMVIFSVVIVLLLMAAAAFFGWKYLQKRKADNQQNTSLPVIVVNEEETSSEAVDSAPAETTAPLPTETVAPLPTKTVEGESSGEIVAPAALGECLYLVQIDGTISEILVNRFGVDYVETADYEQRDCEEGTVPMTCQGRVVITDHNAIEAGDWLVIPEVDQTTCEENGGVWYTPSQ